MCPLDEIVEWNKARRLTDFVAEAEYNMLTEELQEFYAAYSDDDESEMVDALCDIIVLATGALHKLGYNPREALLETAKEINGRQGTFDEASGKWRKYPHQDPATLYKADYGTSKY